MPLTFFIFGSRTVLPDSHLSGIIAVSTCRSVNAFLDAFCTGSNFFRQKFWMPSIPGAVKFFGVAISLFIFLPVMANSLTRFALLHSSFQRWFILSPGASPKLNKSLHLGHFTFALFHCFQSSKKAYLASLEHDVMFISIVFFNVFLQLHLLVIKRIKPLLLNDS